MSGKEVIWESNQGLLDYDLAESAMEDHVHLILEGKAKDKIWLVEHDHVYTLGVSAKESDIINPVNVQTRYAKRGGKITYHGPGMRIIYVMLDLAKSNCGKDIRKFIQSLEMWIIASLKHYNIDAFIREDRVGLWVVNGNREEKIAAIGVRVRKWVTYHGIAVNISPDLTKFANIVPCGIDSKSYGVTSLERMGIKTNFSEFDAILKEEFVNIFG